MNKICITGNMTKDPETKVTTSGVDVCNFTVAVQRAYKNKDGEYEADFINCVAYRQSAVYVGKYLRKGSKVAVDGSLQIRSYTAQDGSKRYATEVIAERIESLNSRQETQNSASANVQRPLQQNNNGFTEIADDALPF